MTGYLCKILKDSINPEGNRLTTFHLRFPRLILAQFNTHRVFSRNAASSRAIPTNTLVKRVKSDPIIPAWTKNQKGMTGPQMTADEVRDLNSSYLSLVLDVADRVEEMSGQFSPHKQNINRLLEPFMWVDVIVSATDWDNFLGLRIADDAQEEIEIVAKSIAISLYDNEPSPIDWGEWHLPYLLDEESKLPQTKRIKISAARCARVSYKPHDMDKCDIDRDLELADSLIQSGHWSPFEHQAQAWLGKHANFNGFTQARMTLGHNRRFEFKTDKIDQWKHELAGMVQGIE